MPPPVALLTPFAFPSVRGNAITVARIAQGMRARGVDVRVWDLAVAPEGAVAAEMAEHAPALIHAFHAYRAGPLALRLARAAAIPLLVTITGTDANQDLFDPDRTEIVRRVLEGAALITVFDESIALRIASALPDLVTPIAVVPQSVAFPPPAADGGAPAGPAGPGPVVLFPAGIRGVKNPRLPLAALDAVAPRHAGLELLYVGPILDRDEGEALLSGIAARPWARYLGAVPHARMRGLFEASDLVLNCSASEGGMPNAVLEALALGRAVLASNIEGNRSLVEDGVTGLLFDTPEALAAQADRLLGDPELRRRLGEAGRARVTTRFGPGRELDGYLTVYAQLTPALRGA